MKNILLLLFAVVCLSSSAQQVYRPYIKAVSTPKTLTELKPIVKQNLEAQGFQVVGQYQPAADANRWLLVVTHPTLLQCVQRVGGLTGFAATLRVAITREGNSTIVSYTNPEYWLRAYYQDSFEKVAKEATVMNTALAKSLSTIEGYAVSAFGSKKGLDSDDLKDYNYMMGMPGFDDTVLLKQFASHKDAVAHIDAKLKSGLKNVRLVSKVQVPGKNLVVYSLALSGENGEAKFLPIIDISTPKHTAFLPYEILVTESEVVMLHGRFRIALSLPDLTMGTFTKIMSTPGDIEELMKAVVQ